ncbi:helix-turn-helix transcriptional regulator [Ectobacillus ponti]|uniref:Helix-turn-helix domain-containing protein n=1 Tax=Ectobacillus ponti TaxID=2961894 RepID=A0AA41X574_9BACI|nr:helix-turn-helix domain-containing protein [Ectobacillus ponti]MCP8968972.1 helix-turn-helix domain-containing protein [Ectobacillus ponti]
MNRGEAIVQAAAKMKLVRTEGGYSQEKMAEILGLSKKTLVQIEKGRILPSWTTVIAVCALFPESETLQAAFGSDPLEVVQLLAREHVERRREKTMGGKVWWQEVARQGRFRLQRNVITQHYRVLDEGDYRWFSTFDQQEAEVKMLSFCEQLP